MKEIKEEEFSALSNNSTDVINITRPPHHDDKIEMGMNPVYSFLLIGVGAVTCAAVTYFLTMKYYINMDDVSYGSESESESRSLDGSGHSLELGGMKPQTASFAGDVYNPDEEFLDSF